MQHFKDFGIWPQSMHSRAMERGHSSRAVSSVPAPASVGKKDKPSTSISLQEYRRRKSVPTATVPSLAAALAASAASAKRQVPATTDAPPPAKVPRFSFPEEDTLVLDYNDDLSDVQLSEEDEDDLPSRSLTQSSHDEDRRVVEGPSDQVVGESASSSAQPESQSSWDKFMAMFLEQERRNEQARARREEQLLSLFTSREKDTAELMQQQSQQMGQLFEGLHKGLTDSFKSLSSVLASQAQSQPDSAQPSASQAEPVLPVESPPRQSSPTRSLAESQSVMDEDDKDEYLYRKERRKLWIDTLPKCVPDFVPPPTEEPLNEGDKFFAEHKSKSRKGYPAFPLQKGIPVHLQNRIDAHFAKLNQPAGRKKVPFNPVSTYQRVYRATDPDHASLIGPHAVSGTLMAEMPEVATQCRDLSHKARLDVASSHGKAEKVALHQQDLAQVGLRIINSQQTDVNALKSIQESFTDSVLKLQTSTDVMAAAQFQNLDTLSADQSQFLEIYNFVTSVKSAASLLDAALQDLRDCSADLFNLFSSMFISAVTDRRKAWLEASRLKPGVVKELNAMPIDCLVHGVEGAGDLLGKKATARVEQEAKNRKQLSEFQLSQVARNAVQSVGHMASMVAPKKAPPTSGQNPPKAAQKPQPASKGKQFPKKKQANKGGQKSKKPFPDKDKKGDKQ
mgnify:CR=1 FL=1